VFPIPFKYSIIYDISYLLYVYPEKGDKFMYSWMQKGKQNLMGNTRVLQVHPWKYRCTMGVTAPPIVGIGVTVS